MRKMKKTKKTHIFFTKEKKNIQKQQVRGSPAERDSKGVYIDIND
jgi:hypothetical protein